MFLDWKTLSHYNVKLGKVTNIFFSIQSLCL